jgi:homoserine O-acetyltransferase
MHMVQYKTFDLGPFALQKGTVLPDAKIVYATVGRLNDAKDNAVLVPTWGSGSPEDVVGLLIGSGRSIPKNISSSYPIISAAASHRRRATTPHRLRKGVFRG